MRLTEGPLGHRSGSELAGHWIQCQLRYCQNWLLGSVLIERELLVSTIVLYLLHLSTCIDSSYIIRRDRK